VNQHLVKDRKRMVLLYTGLALASIVLALVSFGVGYYKMGIGEVFRVVFGQSEDANGWIVLGIRLPRILAAYLIGAALSVSGAAYQGVLKNPLVSSDILGVASGAGLGAAIAIMLRLNTVFIQVFALTGGIAAVALTYTLARSVRFDRRVGLILSGVIVGSLAFAVTTTLKYAADTADQLPEITYWLMGSLSKVDLNALLISLPFMAVGFALMFAMRWRINVLTLSDAEAAAMGVNVRASTLAVIAGATMLSAAAVCLGGLIGWVGLMIPHISRAVAGPQYSRLLPVSAMLGGVFLLAMDDIVRSAAAMEFPIGLAVAFIGAPFFFILIRREGRI